MRGKLLAVACFALVAACGKDPAPAPAPKPAPAPPPPPEPPPAPEPPHENKPRPVWCGEGEDTTPGLGLGGDFGGHSGRVPPDPIGDASAAWMTPGKTKIVDGKLTAAGVDRALKPYFGAFGCCYGIARHTNPNFSDRFTFRVVVKSDGAEYAKRLDDIAADAGAEDKEMARCLANVFRAVQMWPETGTFETSLAFAPPAVTW